MTLLELWQKGVDAVRGATTVAAALQETALAEPDRSEEHTSELQSHSDLVCRLLLEKKKQNQYILYPSDRTSSLLIIPPPLTH